MTRDQLLLAITRCPELAKARRDESHPCSTIASIQPNLDYHVPEPWSGHVDTAPILFVSSNPSISESERYPTPLWDYTDTIDFFQRRFDPDAGYSYVAFSRVRFWSSVKRRAEEITQRPAVPGKDFALTELVHCKSRGEHGVSPAFPTCSRMWLSRVMKQSGAKIIILLGRFARDAGVQHWRLDRHRSVHHRSVHFDVPIAGLNRAVLFLPHPNAFARKTVAGHTNQAERRRLRSLLR